LGKIRLHRSFGFRQGKEEQIPEMVAQLLAYPPAVDSPAIQVSGHPEASGEISFQDGLSQPVDAPAVHDSEKVEDFLIAQIFTTECQELFQQALSVAHAAVGFPCNGVIDGVGQPGVLPADNLLQVLHGQFHGNSAKVEPLAPAENRCRDLVRFRGGHEEKHMARRFLQGFEEGVEGLGGEHVDFIDDVNLEPALARAIPNGLTQLADVVDAAIGGSVNLDDVHGIALGDLPAIGALIARERGYSLFAVEASGKDSGNGGLADSPGAREQVRMGDALGLDGVAKNLGYVRLADDLIEGPRAPLSC